MSYADLVLERLSAEQGKEVASLLIEYIQDEVPIAKRMGQPPERTAQILWKYVSVHSDR